ncbi:hypothetical protein IU433_17515 [Nocardia puris]|uniref:hypothetical protein n=1 Tax=Nocardia puris TaxID=208602 RepID=UPI001895BF82|nr:hypothetical protein [Nocardia puris]MBF6212243.1 hypothetical protein [Nocardia puris]MBF6370151.1 hypothetical protein [Nocardia puris]MBF6460832.1 hypothetical protein [Nocardia puris]
MNGRVRLRLSGDLGDITMVLAELLASKAFRIVVDEHPYPNRRDPGVRVYVELALPTPTTNGQETPK